jgi:tetratricopeptide (TPR) repeat protein
VPAELGSQSYSRDQILRMLEVSDRQLRSWEKQEFVRGGSTFSFRDMIALKALAKLRAMKVPPQKIRLALASLRRKMAHVESPLSELALFWDGRRIAVGVSGQKMEALTGQILLDFDETKPGGVTAFESRPPRINAALESEMFFQQGLNLEETGAPIEEAIEAYLKAIELNPGAAGALVNVGTIYFRQRKLKKAEKCYRDSIAADPEYPLAHFNLANLYDEQGKSELARQFYLSALKLDPNYADAYFNLALVCEQAGEGLKALSYWKAYLKLDGSSSWAEIARREVDRLTQAAIVVSR